jgi:hypothetical protein
MSTSQHIVFPSRANNGAYDEGRLPTQNWAWPTGTWFQKRRRYLRELQRRYGMKSRPAIRSNGFGERTFVDQEKKRSIGFSMVPLLLAADEIPPRARAAVLENRRQDAAEVLMQEFGLSCSEAGQLLDIAACNEGA